MPWTPPEKSSDEMVREYLSEAGCTPDDVPRPRELAAVLPFAVTTIRLAIRRWREDWYRSRGLPDVPARRSVRALTDAQVEIAREMRAEGQTFAQIAARFGVDPKTAADAALGRNHYAEDAHNER